jgi:hypothetical protein
MNTEKSVRKLDEAAVDLDDKCLKEALPMASVNFPTVFLAPFAAVLSALCG